MVFAKIVSTMMLSILRKRLHRFLIAALAAPLILSTVILSTPSLPVFIDAASQRAGVKELNLLVFQDGFNDCSPIQVAGVAHLSDVELPLIVIPESLFKEKTLYFEKVNESCEFTSIPMDIYEKHRGELVVVDGFKRCVSHVHRGINAVILLSLEPIESGVKLCNVSYVSVLKHALMFLEKDILEVSTAWLTALLLVYVPLVYIAISRVCTVLSDEFKVLLNLGVSRIRVVLGFTTAMIAACAVIALFLVSTSIVAVNALHKFMNLYWFTPQLYPKATVALIVFKALCITFLTSMIAGLRRINYA